MTAERIPMMLNKMLLSVFSWKLPFIVLSEKEKETLTKHFGAERVEVLPNTVDLNDAALHQRGMKDEQTPLIIGYLGRIEPNKGMTELLEAARLLKSKDIPFQITMAGKEEKEGEYLNQFQQTVGNDFQYAGVVSGKGKSDFLSSVDVFVLPSYFEGLPMSLLECMSYGAVPVVTPVGSIPEVVEEGINGLFIKVRDAQSIVDAITSLHHDRKRLLEMGNCARTTIFEKFSTEKYVGKLNCIYNDLQSECIKQQ